MKCYFPLGCAFWKFIDGARPGQDRPRGGLRGRRAGAPAGLDGTGNGAVEYFQWKAAGFDSFQLHMRVEIIYFIYLNQ